ncbi:MAG: LysM peptidoglycan-binding domain-containing protein [Lentisphaerae bacterium]|nr:LysM peptidoglycan-binding domain-containing protein [Lentisphaerota bacterium]
MRKSIFFAITGAGLLLTGCNATNHRYQTIPVDNPEPAAQTPAPAPAPRRPAPQTPVVAPTPIVPPAPAPQTPPPPAARPQYTPMTGAVSSGGIDSSSSSSRGSSSGATASQSGTHTVKRGENPATIARKYGVSLSALMAANNLTEDSAKKLRIGQKLIIPARGSSSSSGRSSASSAPASDNAPAVGSGQHRVRRGETPDVIARRYRVSVKDLMAANNLTEESARRLQIGQVLIIPGRSSGSSSSTSAAPASTPAGSGSSTASAPESRPTPASAPTSAEDPMLMETELLDITENTTYAAVAARYGITEATLRALNGGTTESSIPRGAVILVPKK